MGLHQTSAHGDERGAGSAFEIEIEKDILLSAGLAVEISGLLAHCGVIVMRNVGMTAAEHAIFTRTLLPAMIAGGNGAVANGGGRADGMTLDHTINPVAAEFRNPHFWEPGAAAPGDEPVAGIISCSRVPEGTVPTEFADCRAAWQALPEVRQRELANLRVIHADWRDQLYHETMPAIDHMKEWLAARTRELPLVRMGVDGRAALVVADTALQIVGMPFSQSEELLASLRLFATQPRFVYRHKWRPGDLVLWNSAQYMCRALPQDSGDGWQGARSHLARKAAEPR